MDAIGCECKTSFYFVVSESVMPREAVLMSYPAGVWIQEPPPDPVRPDLLHSSTSIKEHGQHPFPKVDYLLVVLRIGRVCRVIGHGVLLRDWRDDERRMESRESFSQRSELGVSPTNLVILRGDD